MNFIEYLEEDNFLQEILLPEFDQSINMNNINYNRTIVFGNNGSFKGTIDDNKPKKGTYTWPNGQKYSGNFSNNFFNGKGCLTFPNNSKLYGKFSGDQKSYLIKDAIYITADKKYQGSFKNNLLHGEFVIKNIDGQSFYSFAGKYYNGVKDGDFILEKEVNNERIEIIGQYNKGLKNGHFFFKKFNLDGKFIEEKHLYFDNDYIINYYDDNQKIENKIRKNNIPNYNEIYCMTIFEREGRKFVLLGSELYLLIYNINEDTDYSIEYNRRILMFNRGKINDILIIKNGNKLLLCTNTNKFKLIELSFATNGRVNIRHKLIQEFKGRENGKSIYMLLELSNELVISGDSQNIIIWGKNNIENNDNNDNNHNNDNNDKNEKNEKNEIRRNESQAMDNQSMNIFHKIFERAKHFYSRNCPNCLVPNNIINASSTEIDYRTINEENYDDNDTDHSGNFNYQQKFYIDRDEDGFDLSHIFCVLEINKNNYNNIIVIAVAQSESKNLYFFEINDGNEIDDSNNYRQIKKIENINSIRNSRKIMHCVDNDNILLVGCYNRVAIVQILNNYELIKFVNFNSITNFSNFKGDYFICATMEKKGGLYNYQSFLTQGELVKTGDEENKKIRIISQNLNYHKGNIIDTSIINVNNNTNNLIISIGSDNQIIALL